MHVAVTYLSPVSDEEEPDGRQDGEHEVGPDVLQGGTVERRGREEVAEQDQVNDARDDLDQDLSRGSMPCCPQHSTSTLGFGFDIQLLYFLSRRISVYRGQIKCVSYKMCFD